MGTPKLCPNASASSNARASLAFSANNSLGNELGLNANFASVNPVDARVAEVNPVDVNLADTNLKNLINLRC